MLLLLQQLPDAQRLRYSPGLSITTALGMRRVAVNNFGQLADAALLHQTIHAAQVGFGRRDGFRRKIPRARQCFAENRKGPGPSRAIMVSGLSAGVFVSLVLTPVGKARIVEESAVASVVGQRNGCSQGCQCP